MSTTEPLGKIPYKNESDRKKGLLFKIALYATVGFFVLSLPVTYRAVDQLYYLISKNRIFDESGILTIHGIAVNTGIFFLFICYLLFFMKY